MRTYMYTYVPSGTGRYLFKLDGILTIVILTMCLQIARETGGRTGESGLREAEI